ncbi:MAG: hypothetical protein AAGA48_22225 [Myxococcota bacterium]
MNELKAFVGLASEEARHAVNWDGSWEAVAFRVVEALENRNGLTVAWFQALAKERRGRHEEVAAVASLYGIPKLERTDSTDS